MRGARCGWWQTLAGPTFVSRCWRTGRRGPSASCRCAAPTSTGLEQAARHYLAQAGDPAISEAAIDVATAVTGDLVKLTNSPWAFSIEQTKRQLGAATAPGAERLHRAGAVAACAWREGELRQVGRGTSIPDAPIALIGAGTGLGRVGAAPLRRALDARSRAKVATPPSALRMSARTQCWACCASASGTSPPSVWRAVPGWSTSIAR